MVVGATLPVSEQKHSHRFQSLLIAVLALATAVAGFAKPSLAWESAEGRVQVHGFGEVQLRTMNEDLSDQWDLAQWYNILNVEIEADLLPEGLGFIERATAFVRLEARYDCVYSDGCGAFNPGSYSTSDRRLAERMRDAKRSGYAGDRLVMTDGHGTDTRFYHGVDVANVENWEGYINPLPGEFLNAQTPINTSSQSSGSSEPARAWQLPGIGSVFVMNGSDNVPFDETVTHQVTGAPVGTAVGPDGIAGTEDDGMSDDAIYYVFEDYLDYEFALQKIKGPEAGNGTRLMFIDFQDINSIGDLNDKANPWRGYWDYYRHQRAGDKNPLLGRDNYDTQVYLTNGSLNPNGPGDPDNGFPNPPCAAGAINAGPNGGCPIEWRNGASGYSTARLVTWTGLSDYPFGRHVLSQGYGQGERPFRPAPFLGNTDKKVRGEAQGLYYPNAGLQRLLKEYGSDLKDYDQNFSEDDLKWNRGASQDQTKELKEAYVDLEMMEGRLWMRLGKQSIVWGKTELFRTTDQFNPQDFTMSTIPDLEASRIALWSGRFIYSLYEVGPLDDVRLEFAVNTDEFVQADLGRCGEPFVPDVACGIATGYLAHGFAALGLAGTTKPEDPWDDTDGIETGERIEFRWDRFSFALTHFNGYDDFPHPDRFFTYSRSVDVNTGMPLRAFAVDGCDPDNGITAGCLGYISAEKEQEYREYRMDNIVGVDENGALISSNLLFNQPWLAPDFLELEEAEEAYLARKEDVLNNATTNQQLFAMGCAITYGALRNMNNNVFGLDWDCGAGALTTEHMSSITQGKSYDSQLATSWLFAGSNFSQLRITVGGLGLDPTGGAPLAQSGRIKQQYQSILLDPGAAASQTLISVMVPLNTSDNDWDPCDEYNGNLNGKLDRATADAQQRACALGTTAETALRIGALDDTLSAEQEALIGCGPFYGQYRFAAHFSDMITPGGGPGQPRRHYFAQQIAGGCDIGGVDLLNAEASVLLQSWNIIDGAPLTTLDGIQPGTVAFQGGAVATRWDRENAELVVLPGARSKYFWDGKVHNSYFQENLRDKSECSTGVCIIEVADLSNYSAGAGPDGQNIFDLTEDRQITDSMGRVLDAHGNILMAEGVPIYLNPDWDRDQDGDPVYDATSIEWDWNTSACPFSIGGAPPGSGFRGPQCQGDPLAHPWVDGAPQYFNSELAALSFNFQVLSVTSSRDWDAAQPFALDHCSLAVPRLCKNVRDLAGGAVNTAPMLRAGGNKSFGRRDFVWQSGSVGVLDYQKRHVFGFSTDFAEDRTKTNWSVETTYIGGVPAMDQNSFSGLKTVDRYNMTVSMDRPTFINFLNPGRTFFINSQWFFSYTEGYESSFTENGPLNVLFTLTAFTGYFQDRLQPMITSVYDFQSVSGAVLPSISYKFSDRLFAEFGMNFFYGRFERKDASIVPFEPANRIGSTKNASFQENGLSAVRDHDEIFMRFRYTF